MLVSAKRLLDDNKFLNNFVRLFFGQNFSYLLQMISLWIIITAIGNEANGMLIIIQTYCYLINDLTNMQTFNAVIKFVSESILQNNVSKAKQFIKLGYIIDFSTGLIAFVLGFLLFHTVADLMKWNSDIYRYVIIYLPVIIVRNALSGTSTGMLRYLDKYNAIISINVFISVLRVILYFVFWQMKAEFLIYLLSEAILEFTRGLLLIFLSIHGTRQYGYQGFWKEKLDMKDSLSFIKFNIYNGITLTMDLLLGDVSNMFISKYLGFSMISVYRVLERIGSLAQLFTVPLVQLYYPEMCEFIGKGKRGKATELFKKYVIISTPICVSVLFILLLFYKNWMSLFIATYQEYYIITVAFLIFALFSAITVPIHSLMIAFGYVKQTAIFVSVINLIYILLLGAALTRYGLLGLIILKILQAIVIVVFKSVKIRIDGKRPLISPTYS